MAAEAPQSIDVTAYEFKLHNKLPVFDPAAEVKSNVNLLATASPFGLLFLGDQNKPEIKVIQLQNFVDSKETGEEVLARIVPIPGLPHNLATSSDGSLLAVNYAMNGSALLAVYSVSSFLSANIICKNLIGISADDNVQALQLLWNPVLATNIAIVLSNGALSVYNLKDMAYEFYSIDKQEQAKCACWSPKGKQIVVGHPNGKLVQFKPDLKAARTIVCPPNIHDGPFDTIAVQWLSTYQFAAVFLQHGVDMSPALYIVNAPKVGTPTYINYYDICYSSSGPRAAQIFLTYIQPWNILLMSSANSIEVGVLGTAETGEAPTWTQYITPDNARIELPLSSDKEETHPIGFALETGTTHQLVIAEKIIPVMPIIHILSTHGLLVSFDFLNFAANAPSICSPPMSIADMSGLNFFQPISKSVSATQSSAPPVEPKIISELVPTAGEVSFSLPSGATSTPSLERKTKPLFGNTTGAGSLFSAPSGTVTPSIFSANAPIKPTATTGSLFSMPQTSQASVSTAPLSFGGGQSLGQKPTAAMPFSTKNAFGKTPFGQSLGTSTTESSKALSFGILNENSASAVVPNKAANYAKNTGLKTSKVSISSDTTKPLYTVPSTYNASQQPQSMKKEELNLNAAELVTTSEDNDILKESIKEQIQAFEMELKDLANRSKDIDITIGTDDESKECVKQLNELQELSDQALESTESLASDMQTLRQSLNECFVMIAETKSKLNMFNNPGLPQLASMSNLNQSNRRQLIKLKSILATNEAQIQIVNHQIDAQWSNYQDLCRKSRTKMRIPSLEAVYQTLTKQKDILARERLKLNNIKSRLGIKSIIEQNASKKNDINIESLADRILSMSLSDQVKAERSCLTEEKLKVLRSILQNRKIVEIKPHRPDRIGINSEVIQEVRIRTAKQREGASTKPEKMEKLRIRNASQHIAKPTPTKPIAVNPMHAGGILVQNRPLQKQQPIAIKPSPVTKTTSNSLSFNPGIIKPTATTQPNKEISFASSSGFSFGNTLQKTPSTVAISFGGSNQLSFSAKDDKQISVSLLPSTNENTPKEPPPSVSLQPNLPLSTTVDKPIANLGGFSAHNQPKTISINPKSDSNSSFTTHAKPTAVITLTEVRSDESTSEAKHEKEAKPQTPFTVVSLSQSSGLRTVLSFDPNVTKTESIFPKPIDTQSSTSIGSIFGGQTTISKTAGIFESPGQPILGFDQPQSPTTTSLFTPAANVFTPLSIVSDTAAPTTSSGMSSSAAVSSFPLVSKPTTENVTHPTVIAPTVSSPASGGFGFGGIATTSASGGFEFGLTATTTTSSSISTFSFASFAKSIASSAPTTVSSTTTTASSVATTDSCAPITPTPESTISAITSNSDDASDSFFRSLNICKPSTVAASTVSTTTTNAFAGSVFNTSSFDSSTSTPDIFGAPLHPDKTGFAATSQSIPTSSVFTTPATITASAVPEFGGVLSAVTSASVFSPQITPVSTQTAAPALFGSSIIPVAASTVPANFGISSDVTSTVSPISTGTSAFGTPSSTTLTTVVSSPFISTAPVFGATTSANIFAGIPKPDQSVFAGSQISTTIATTNSPFGGTAAPAASPFSTSPTAQQASGGNLFGSAAGGTVGFGAQPNAGSIFGGGSPGLTQQSNPFTTPSVFSAQKTETSNLFGSQTQANQMGGTNFFGASSFGDSGQTTGSIFGGGNTSPIQPGAFSTTGAFGQSPFANVQQQQQQSTSPFAATNTAFGGFGGASGFGQSTGFNTTSTGGSFAQVGQQSVVQTGFGSPTGFTKPAFGAAPAFGSPPTFGGTPTFGGGATFGSQKSPFSSFATNTATFSPPAQKNNIFDELGSTDTGLSFGNLAQNTNNASGEQQFGGSSFSSWR